MCIVSKHYYNYYIIPVAIFPLVIRNVCRNEVKVTIV